MGEDYEINYIPRIFCALPHYCEDCSFAACINDIDVLCKNKVSHSYMKKMQRWEYCETPSWKEIEEKIGIKR